jgi:GNAT superfamily N-acetyltransferase
MALAFDQEPNFRYMLQVDDARERQLTWFFGTFVIRLGFRYGEVYTTPDGTGTAVWMRPGARVSLWGAIRAGLLVMPVHLGPNGTRRSMAFGSYVERVRRKVAPPMHWYLTALGVHPVQQGRGLGRALLQPVLARADLQGTSCYLETFRERTAAFYTQFGFATLHTDHIPEGGPPFWCMGRQPG